MQISLNALLTAILVWKQVFTPDVTQQKYDKKFVKHFRCCFCRTITWINWTKVRLIRNSRQYLIILVVRNLWSDPFGDCFTCYLFKCRRRLRKQLAICQQKKSHFFNKKFSKFFFYCLQIIGKSMDRMTSDKRKKVINL